MEAALEVEAASEEVLENLGHASPATTAIYSHTERHRRKAVTERLPTMLEPEAKEDAPPVEEKPTAQVVPFPRAA
jgi:hypothetical protein